MCDRYASVLAALSPPGFQSTQGTSHPTDRGDQMTTIAPDPTLAEADVAVFEALVERTVGELGRRRGVLETVRS